MRAKFVETSLKLLEDYGLDGLDVDYEYPTDDKQASGYTALLKELRAALDKRAAQKGSGCKFLLSVSNVRETFASSHMLTHFISKIAAPCGPEHYKKLQVSEMDKSLDFWNLMAYDFCMSFSPYVASVI